jgi:hypothetical protein
MNDARSHFPEPVLDPMLEPTAVLIVLSPDPLDGDEAEGDGDAAEDEEDPDAAGCSFSTKYSSSEVRSGVIAISRMRSRLNASIAAS